jgi:hypothetical protein
MNITGSPFDSPCTAKIILAMDAENINSNTPVDIPIGLGALLGVYLIL